MRGARPLPGPLGRGRARAAEKPVSPVAEALKNCTTAAELNPAAVVLFSGGKDSLAVLDLCVRTFTRVEAAFMYLVPGIRFIEEPMERVCARLGVKLHKVPHWDTARMLKHAVLRWHNPGADTPTRNLHLPDVEAALRQRTGIQWIASGWKGCDGMQRRLVLRQWGAVATKWWRLFPIAAWRDRDVLAYLRSRHLALPEQVAKGKTHARATGLGLGGPQLSWLLRTHPEDYQRVIAVFPFADALRWEYDRRHAEKTPSPAAVV